jgi:3-keto-5-aminohexanoate cleavage enzyme
VGSSPPWPGRSLAGSYLLAIGSKAMEPVMITVAAIGAELTRADQPRLPIAPDEIAADAVQCRAAGASIYHLHVRDSSGDPTMDVDAFRSAHEAIQQATDLIVQFTSGGAVGDTEEARAAPLELRPEMATLTTGSVNFGDEVFLNPRDLVQRFYERMRSLSILPEFEIFDAGMIAGAERLAKRADHHLHYDFVLGAPSFPKERPGAPRGSAATISPLPGMRWHEGATSARVSKTFSSTGGAVLQSQMQSSSRGWRRWQAAQAGMWQLRSRPERCSGSPETLGFDRWQSSGASWSGS